MLPDKDLPAWKPDLRSPVLVGGRFQLLDEIGQGATSVVYKARDTGDGQVVALKVLKGTAALHPRLLAGFQREAEVGERIRHPNVIRIFGSGVHDGWLYLVMEHVTGRTLADTLAMTPRLSLPECEPLFRQLLAALDCIHREGIVHRDLKPANIMMAREGAWKLMDFGISRELGADATVGPALGTPEYMSPEQLMGKAATQASDIYSAGVVFYEVLCGEVPFHGWQPLARCTRQPKPVRERRREIPEWLDRMVSKALSPLPEARFGSAAAMLGELGVFEPEVVADAGSAQVTTPEAEWPAAPAPATRPLADLMHDEPCELKKVLAVAAATLRCLESLAETGHEPLTPHTLRLDEAGRIQIAAHGPTGESDTMVVSLPKYTPPELLRGRGPITPAGRVKADLYALGFLLYELLLGRDLFRREFPGLEDRGTELGWMEWHSNPAHKVRPAAQVVMGTPAPISQLLDSLLEKDPEKRPGGYAEVLAPMQELLRRTSDTQQIRLPSNSEPARKRRIHPVLTSIGVAALLLATAALILRLLN
jgi:eukaryotic-like serine/threonine-protein kinase